MTVDTANRLMQYRKKAGLSQEELADKLGVSRQAVSKWECAESSPDTDNLIALAKIYNVSLDELINGDEDPKINKDNKEKKSGIHIKGEDGEVHIEGMNIHVKDDGGSEVHIGTDGIDIVDGETNFHAHPKVRVHRHHRRDGIFESILSSSITLLCVTAYLLCGFLIKDGQGWRNYWVIFFLIPIVPSIFKAIRTRRMTRFAFPLLVTAVYLGIGMFMNLWHPTWIMFFAIPVYYAVFGPIEKYREDHGTLIIDNDEDD
ncbi:MAG: helix-turn-helix domain-containing protein [Bacilli bacterium]|nr:helix-turn-helix domain-containing protein [Bacilli bacterium]